MNKAEWERQADDMALARYSVISPLICRQLSDLDRVRVKSEILGAVHLFPDGRMRRVSRRSFDRWCEWYVDGHLNADGEVVTDPGIEALRPILRSDCGRPRTLDEHLVHRAIEFRREEPSRTTSALIELLKSEAPPDEVLDICEATLAYHLRHRKATKKDLKREGRAYRRYEHARRNSSWQGDWSQGLRLPDATNPSKTRLCHLHAFICDHTRYIVHAEFYFHQNLPCLEDCLRKAILHGGVPEIVYVDNGKVYHSRQLQLVAARLTTQLVFATPYCPEGKGKVERWFRTVKDAFYPEAERAGLQSLDELNQFFWGWLERVYHSREHSETKQTPRARWEAGASVVRYPEPAQLVDLFLWEEKRRVDKSGSIRLSGNLYSVAEHLVGQEVTIRFDPFDISRIRLYEGGRFSQVLEPQTLVSKTFIKAHRKKKDDKSPLDSAVNFRKKVSEDYRNQAQEVQKRVRGSGGSCLTQAEFLSTVATTLGGRHLTAAEATLVQDFFHRNAPLTGSQVRASLQKAIDVKGAALHLRYYLEAIKAGRLEGKDS
jgi:putative transposase